MKNEALEQKEKQNTPKLMLVTATLQEAQKEAHDLRKEVHQIKQITDGKRYLLQCTFGGRRFALLTRIWGSRGAIADLPKSAAEADKYYASQEGVAQQRMFWVQFQNPKHPQLVSNHLKQLMELHKMTEPAMKDLCMRLWPTEPLPSSYFFLVQKLIAASPQINVMKRSICVEGARMAFERIMMHRPKVEPLKIATMRPPPGKEHIHPKLYFSIAMEGARAVEVQ
ncbi:hypothetical protein ZWY2020_029180 [Hordeum vulgare]|nr:hypothetical protein ZWY2020_029180 [Hordeum vulgare]